MTDIPSNGINGGQDSTPETGNESTGSVREMAGAAANTVKQEAANFAASAQDKAVEQVEKHKDTATQTLGAFADAIRHAGDQLSQNDQSAAGRMVRQAAQGLETFTRSVEGKRPEELIDAVRDFGRRNPTVFVAGSVLVGIALARFFKASGENEGGMRSATGGAPPYDAGSDPTPSAQRGGWVAESGAGGTSGGLSSGGMGGDVCGELDDEPSPSGAPQSGGRFTSEG